MEPMDKPERDQGGACYTSTIQLLPINMENCDIPAKFARRQAALDAQLAMLGAIIGLDSAEDEGPYLPMTRGWYHLTSRHCPDQTGHNAFEVQDGMSPAFFRLVSGPKVICVLVCHVLHTYLHYLISENKELVEVLRLEEVNIPVYSVFFRLFTCSMEDVSRESLI